MTAITPLESIHKKGLFGNHHEKNEKDLVKISEVKDLTIIQIVQYKRSKVQLSSVQIDDLEFSVNMAPESIASIPIISSVLGPLSFETSSSPSANFTLEFTNKIASRDTITIQLISDNILASYNYSLDGDEDGIPDDCEEIYTAGLEEGILLGGQSGDSNGDGELNILDIVYFVDVILNP